MSDLAVQIRGLRKRYGQQFAVDGLNLDVPRGSVFGLLGPNGAGKSTTFGICCGWLRPTEGSVTVLGVPADEVWRLQGRVAALPQDAHFPANVTIRRSLAHFARLSGVAPAQVDAAVQEALERVGLVDAAQKTGAQLSHGMHKRVGLAQALLGPPEVVFLDEPTSGLDPRTAHEIKTLIASLAPRTTVILSSHNLAEVEAICTHGAILDHGRLTIVGPIEQLTRRGGELRIVTTGLRESALSRVRAIQALGDVRRDEETLIVQFGGAIEPQQVVRSVLTCLFEQDIGVLEVHRGTSLERAFLEFTAGAAKS